MKLGKLAPKEHPQRLWLEKYLLPSTILPVQPKVQAWQKAVSTWGMFKNDVIGDCTCAAKAHIVMCVTANQGSIVIPTDDETVSLYSSVTGYDPSKVQPDGSNPTDNGAAMTDVYGFMLKNKFAGQQLLGFAQIDQTNRDHFEKGVYLFDAVDVGVQLPDSAMQQFSANEPFSVVDPDGGIDGGHDIPYFGYTPGDESCVTWSRLVPTSPDWFLKYCDEAYVLIFDSWFDSAGDAPNHVNKDLLWKDLQAMRIN